MIAQLERKTNFLDDKSISRIDVGVTCERYTIKNCEVRRAEPIKLLKREKESNTASVVKAIQKKYS